MGLAKEAAMVPWLYGHKAVLWWLGALSVVTFVGTLVALPLVVARLPPDYFTHAQRPGRRRHAQSSGSRCAVAPGQESAWSADGPRRCGPVAAPWSGDSYHPDWADAARLSRQAAARAAARAAALRVAGPQLDAGQGAPTGVGAAYRSNGNSRREARNLVRMRPRQLVAWPPPGRGQNPHNHQFRRT